MHEEELDILTDATLEDVDGVLVKSYLDGKMFSARRLRLLLEKAGRKRRTVLAMQAAAAGQPHGGGGQVSHPSGEDAPPEILAAFNAASVEWRVRAQILDLGWTRFWKLLSLLLPRAEGTLSYVRPGRSGAQVFCVLAKFREGVVVQRSFGATMFSSYCRMSALIFRRENRRISSSLTIV